MRRLLPLLLLAGGAFFLLGRRREAARERVHVYYGDGSRVTLDRGGPEAEHLLGIARAALA